MVGVVLLLRRLGNGLVGGRRRDERRLRLVLLDLHWIMGLYRKRHTIVNRAEEGGVRLDGRCCNRNPMYRKLLFFRKVISSIFHRRRGVVKLYRHQ